MKNSVELYLAEQQYLEKKRQEHPELFQSNRAYSYQEIMNYIGIDVDFGYLPVGYLNLFPQDFIVQEVTAKGRVCSIEPEAAKDLANPGEDEKTLYAELVKVGLSSLEAKENLAIALNLSPNQISFAGIKDKIAITSQLISLRGVTAEQILGLKSPGLFLKNLYWGKGVVEKGDLLGNQFIITVRTPVTLGQGWLDSNLSKWQDGFYNFYYLQRFGSPRLLSHKLGKLLLQQQYEEAVRTFLTDWGVQGPGLISQLRTEASENFGDWKKLTEIFSVLPYTFRLELTILEYLISHPADYLGAIKTVGDQATLWVYAYASYLYNSHLSSLIKNGQPLPKELPLLLHPDFRNISTYTEKLKKAGITSLRDPLLALFGRLPISPKNTCPTKSPVKLIGSKILDKAVAIAFELPSASYATTFLSHLFNIYKGLPLPEWLNQKPFDAKAELSLGSIKETEDILKDYIFSLSQKPSDTE